MGNINTLIFPTYVFQFSHYNQTHQALAIYTTMGVNQGYGAAITGQKEKNGSFS